MRQRADDIVCFVALEAQFGNVVRLHQAMNQWQLHRQLIRHPLAVGFVGWVRFVPKRWTAFVKYHCEIIRLLLAHQLLQHIFKAEHGVGRRAIRGRQLLPNRIKGPEYKGRSIDEIGSRSLRHTTSCKKG